MGPPEKLGAGLAAGAGFGTTAPGAAGCPVIENCVGAGVADGAAAAAGGVAGAAVVAVAAGAAVAGAVLPAAGAMARRAAGRTTGDRRAGRPVRRGPVAQGAHRGVLGG